MELRTLGVVGTSRKENERRVPIHPDHFESVPPALRRRLVLERGYGERFGVSDAALEATFGGVDDRERLLAGCDAVVLPQPVAEDFREIRPGGVVWGWAHCTQHPDTTQIAIDRRLTLIAWESMFTWRRGARDLSLFHRTNEMAGYCAVLHALEVQGVDGAYGPPLRAVVLCHGSVSRGAIHALRGRGVTDLTAYTRRSPWTLADEAMGCRYGHMFVDDGSGDVIVEEPDGRVRHLVEALAEADVIVNGILQDIERPLMYLAEGEEHHLRPGSLIIDVSCDAGLGFPFARATTFADPTFRAGPATYYAVDHTPSLLWRSASWEMSRVVVPHLPAFLGGPEAWSRDETIRRAIEIREGVVRNPKILAFQRRAEEYPHEPRRAAS